MLQFFKTLDRRWIFLLMALAVGGSVYARLRFPEKPSKYSQAAFEAIECLPNGSNVLLSMDFDPASAGELAPMAFALTRHCCEKKHKMYFMALWPLGPPMVDNCMALIRREYPDLKYGEDYVNLGYKAGMEGVIKPIMNDFRQLYSTDNRGTSLDQIPMTREIKNVQDMRMIINVSAGYPGSKEWVQYAASPFDIPMVSGSTGVQSPQLYPYIPDLKGDLVAAIRASRGQLKELSSDAPLVGLLAAIKGAAEYEQALIERYPQFADNVQTQEGLRRMGPQLVAHVLMILLIVAGNTIFFLERRKGAQS